MDGLKENINKFFDNKKNPTSERAHVIQVICDTLFSDKDFKKIFGQTSQFTVFEIRQIFDESKSWEKNPQALFWKKIKEKRENIKEKLNG